MSELSKNDEHHLQRALTLAREAASFASPNPTVGCVLTSSSGEVLGEGAHFYDRLDHAEIAALKNAAAKGNSVKGATAYVTLEPCTITGRTGPCSDALIAARIARCVVATADPNPAVHSKGLSRIRAAGIAVTLANPASAIAQEARRLNDAFAFSITHERPFVTLKAALSVDGRLAPPPSQRTTNSPHWLTGEAARADVQQLRHASDAILTGIGTVVADNPSLTDRTGQPRRRHLLRVVLDTHLRTPVSSQLVRSAKDDVLLFCGPDAPNETEAALVQAGVEVVRLPASSPLSPPDILSTLNKRSIRSVLLEAGSALNAAFLAQNLVDQIVLYFSEIELGPEALPFAQGGPSPYALQERLTSLTRATFPHGATEDVRITGYLHNPWASL